MDSLFRVRPLASSIDLAGPLKPGYEKILTEDALRFVAELARSFTPRIEELLVLRRVVQSRFDVGIHPRFRPETRHVRESEWTCSELPAELQRRRVEIVGSVGRRSVVEALNSGADVFVADFEDGTAPSWDNLIRGQLNLFEAVRGELRYEDPESGDLLEVAKHRATLFVRPRGLHLWDPHLRVAGLAVPGALLDFGLHLFHNAAELIARGSGPYFYLPKLQSRLEARLWNDVFVKAQKLLGLKQGTIKATVLIETLPAAFEMDEILWELRRHSAGLSAGRWDYIFSYIKTFREHPGRVLADREQLDMSQPFLQAYTDLIVQTCHRRKVHAMGGTAAEVPMGEGVDSVARDRVREDKRLQIQAGYDGTWVAHPSFVPVAMEAFEVHMSRDNQFGRTLRGVQVGEERMLEGPRGSFTAEGLRLNVAVSLRYIASWLAGRGCVPIFGQMEDAATAEIARSQIWQWLRHEIALEGGELVTRELVGRYLQQELEAFKAELDVACPEWSTAEQAATLLTELTTGPHFYEFFTLPAYASLRQDG